MSIVSADKAKEFEANTMIDKLVDGNGDASWQVGDDDYKPVDRTPRASLMAVALDDAFRAYKCDGVISIGYNLVDHRVEVHCRQEYFLANYKDGVEVTECPEQSYIQHTVMVGDAAVFCIEKAEFKMVRV